MVKDIYALVTGASRGLGKAFAVELARRKINLLLVALRNDGLPELCKDLKNRYQIRCNYFETDLTKKESIDELVQWVYGSFRINILINNAGTGGSRRFEHVETEYLENMISLNIRAVTLITHQLLPELKLHKQSYILNVASMASFSPIGYKTIYPASKVFVNYFTRSLFQELKGTGVFASVLHPGPMKTNNEVVKIINNHGIFGKIGLLTPEYVASKSIEKLFKRKPFMIIGWMNQLSWLFMKIMPVRLCLPVITSKYKYAVLKSSDTQSEINGKVTDMEKTFIKMS